MIPTEADKTVLKYEKALGRSLDKYDRAAVLGEYQCQCNGAKPCCWCCLLEQLDKQSAREP